MDGVRAGLLGLPLLCAGCAAPPPEAPAPAPEAVPPGLPAGFGYACPPGEHVQRGALCSGTIADVAVARSEPQVAVHPRRPGVVAILAHEGHLPAAVGAADGRPTWDDQRIALLVSEDGGATWRSSALPRPAPDEARGWAAWRSDWWDPRVVFDDHGTLHAASLYHLRGAPGQRYDTVLATASADLGATWSPPVAFDAPDADFEQLSAHGERLYLSWWVPGAWAIDLAWSLDRGRTWRQLAPEARPGSCFLASAVREVQGVPYVACGGVEGDLDHRTGIRVFRLDPVGGSLAPVAHLAAMPGFLPHLAEAPPGRLWVLTDEADPPRLSLASTVDHGRTWSTPADALELMRGERRGDAWVVHAFLADPWGALHLVAGPVACGAPCLGLTALGAQTVAPYAGHLAWEYADVGHLALDPEGLRVLADRVLLPREERQVPPSLGYGRHGDYYGLAFGGGRGFLAWDREKALGYALIEPRWDPPPAAGPGAGAPHHAERT